MTKGKNMRNAKQKTPKNIEDETPILPWIVADAVISELETHLACPLRGPECSHELADMLSDHANKIYKHNEQFRKRIRSKADGGDAGRDWLYAFMRHWLTAVAIMRGIRRERIPAEFAIGKPIRAQGVICHSPEQVKESLGPDVAEMSVTPTKDMPTLGAKQRLKFHFSLRQTDGLWHYYRHTDQTKAASVDAEMDGPMLPRQRAA
jgi:hypothetical protein